MVKVLRMLEKMGFVESASGPGEDPQVEAPPVEPAPQPSKDLEPEVRKVHSRRFDAAFEATASSDGAEEFPIAKIYSSAGIEEPEHGFTVYTLLEMMDAEEFSGLDDATRAKVLSGILRRLPSGSVSMDDIVDDAAARDQALDAFEAFLTERVHRSEQELEDMNRKLQEEIDELTRRNSELIDGNLVAIAAERARLAGWCKRKQEEENRLYEAIAPFVTANPVSLSVAEDESSGPQDP